MYPAFIHQQCNLIGRSGIVYGHTDGTYQSDGIVDGSMLGAVNTRQCHFITRFYTIFVQQVCVTIHHRVHLVAGNALCAFSSYIVVCNGIVATLATQHGLLEYAVITDSHKIMPAGKFKFFGQIAAPVKLVFTCKQVGVGAIEHMVIKEIWH